MLDLTKFLVTQIVDMPDKVELEESTDEQGTIIITVTVDPQDMGKVIGKGGKIISAIREIVKVKAIKQNKRVRVILKDPEVEATQTDQPSQPEPEAPPPDMSQNQTSDSE